MNPTGFTKSAPKPASERRSNSQRRPQDCRSGTVPADHLPFVIVADIAGEIVGFATVLPSDDLEAELEDLFVAPERWRTGIGSTLMAEVERRARVFGAHSLHVVAGDHARPFYEACGFEVVSPVMTRFALASGMRKELCRP